MGDNEISKIGHELESVVFIPKFDFKITLSDIPITGKQNEQITIPRWVALQLENEGHGKIHEERNMFQEITQALTKENLNEELRQLATLPKDFYLQVNSFKKKLPENEKDRLESQLRLLVRRRLGKIIQVAHIVPLEPAVQEKLTNEEERLYLSIYNSSKEFEIGIASLSKKE